MAKVHSELAFARREEGVGGGASVTSEAPNACKVKSAMVLHQWTDEPVQACGQRTTCIILNKDE